MRYILAIDEGTTGTTAILMDQNLNLIAEASQDFTQHFPQPGWVEHDLNEVWDAVKITIKKVVSKINPNQIVAIGITNQRETICFWDKKSTQPLSRAIVWQDRRTAKECEALKKRGLEKKINRATGLLLDPYFSGTKAAWALKNLDAVKEASLRKRLAMGTMDSFLIAKLTSGVEHVTEPSNASRTLCFHLTKHVWDDFLCKTMGVKKELWPEVKPSTGLFGKTKNLEFLPDGIPITGVLGDQQAALLGQACIEPGQAKCTYGTGAFLLMNTGKEPAFSKHRLLTTIAWALDHKNYTYALEGSTFIAGAAVQWVRDGLGIIKNSSEIETLASQVKNSEGVVFVPALTGLGAPYWNPDATGMLTGITRGTTRAHVARAVLEGIAFQITDLLIAMQKDLGKKKLVGLNVDGGASANNLLMQFQSDILGVKLRRPKFLESTSLGAVFAAGLGAGIWSNLKEIKKTWKEDRNFNPQIAASQRKSELKRWTDAMKRVNIYHK